MEDAGILALIFFKDIGLHSTTHGGKDPTADIGRFFTVGLTAMFGGKFFQLLIQGGIEEAGQDNGRRPIDGHGHRGAGRAEIKTVVEHLHIV